VGEFPALFRPDKNDPELRVPRVDMRQCIGCGICERQCPVVGSQRGIYVTAEGETRSQAQPHPDRNRSVRLFES
jgi:ferredoxin